MTNDLGKLWAEVQGAISEKYPDLDPGQLKAALERFVVTLPATGVGLGMPVVGTCEQPTLAAALSLCFEVGLHGETIEFPQLAMCRELLVEGFIKGGYERLLLMNHDVAIDGTGFWQLMETMDATGAAAVVPMLRYPDGLYDTVIGGGHDARRMNADDIPRSGTHFPVQLASFRLALLDLTQLKTRPGPRFGSKVVGTDYTSDEKVFAEWLSAVEMDIYCNPNVVTLQFVPQGYRHPPKEQRAASEGASGLVIPNLVT